MSRPFPIPNQVATCAYKQFKEPMGVLIGTSIGNNRQRAGLIYLRSLAPWSTFRKVEGEAEGREVYQAQLDRDIDKIERDLTGLSANLRVHHDGQDPRLVFACFEDLSKPGLFCHRTWLAWWLAATYDIDVPELGATRKGVVASGDTLL